MTISEPVKPLPLVTRGKTAAECGHIAPDVLAMIAEVRYELDVALGHFETAFTRLRAVSRMIEDC